MLGGLTNILRLQISYSMCQKLWKLASSRRSYCKNNQAYFFWPNLYKCWSGCSNFETKVSGRRRCSIS